MFHLLFGSGFAGLGFVPRWDYQPLAGGINAQLSSWGQSWITVNEVKAEAMTLTVQIADKTRPCGLHARSYAAISWVSA